MDYLAGKPTILFIAYVHRDYSPLGSAGYGLGNAYRLLPHKYAVLSLVAWLRAHDCDGHYVWINDINADELLKIDMAIVRHRPDAIGFSLATDEVISHYGIIELLKLRHPDIPIIVGGPHVTALPRHTLEHFPLIDCVAVGEGEWTLTEWLNCTAAGKSKSRMKDINGIGFRDESGKIVLTPPREKIKDLDILPDPAYHLILDPADPSCRSTFLPLINSYGCPFYCTFCAADHGNYRYASPMRAVDRIERAVKQYGVDTFCMCDSFWPPSGGWLDEFCGGIEKRRIKIRFQFETRAGTLSEKQLRRLKRIGVNAVAVGVESGDQEILKNIKKGITLDMARKTFKSLNRLGILSRAFFMFGNQGENRRTIQATIDFMHELNPSMISISTFRPLPGSEAYNLLPDRESDWWMRCNKDGKWWKGGRVPSICDLHHDEILLMAQEALLRFPLRPAYFFQHVAGSRLQHEFRDITRRIFTSRLREYILGMSERHWLMRGLIHTAKVILKRY